MNLDALLDDDAPTVGLKPCRVAKVAASLEEPHLSAFNRIVNLPYRDGGLSPTLAAVKLAKAGLKVSETTIGKHRRGLCGCESVVNA